MMKGNDMSYDLTIIKGKYEGKYTTYWDDEGKKVWKNGEYKNDCKVGRWICYHQNGKIKFECVYTEEHKVSEYNKRCNKDGWIEHFRYHLLNGKIFEFHSPFDENISDWGEDCFEKYYRKLIEEDRRIKNNLPLLYEDGNWELNREQRNYVGEEV